MSSHAPAPPSRRSLRGATGETAVYGAAPTIAPYPAPPVPGHRASRPALGWVDADTVGAAPIALDLDAASSPLVTVGGDLLARRPVRSPFRPAVLAPLATVAGVIALYVVTTLAWPLHSVTPRIVAVGVESAPAPAATPAWPAVGSAAVAIEGLGATLASSDAEESIASITKVVTALMVLDEAPLQVGQDGPSFQFTSADRVEYWDYRSQGESALDVPVGESLSELQMLQGMMVGSANNYADRLARTYWANDAVFSRAATTWLNARGVPGIAIADPTGIEADNRASAAALIPLAQRALADPVLATIVSTREVTLPGAGDVVNTNRLLEDPGVIGIKTGTLDVWNLLAAKDVAIGPTTVRLYAAVLGQPDGDARVAATQALFDQLAVELVLRPAVTAGTRVGVVETAWGATADVVTAEDAAVVLWNGGLGEVETDLALGDARETGAVVGSLTVTGPLDAATVPTRLDGDVEPPSGWWRLLHPLQLFGLAD